MCIKRRFPMGYLNMKNAMLTLPGLLGFWESPRNGCQVTSWWGRFRIWRPGFGDLEIDLCCKWLKDGISRAKKWDTLHWPSISALSLAFRIFGDLGMKSWDMGGVWQGKEPKWITFWLQMTSAKESINRTLTSKSWRVWVLPLITFLKNVSSDDSLGHNTRVPFIDNVMFPFTSLENSVLLWGGRSCLPSFLCSCFTHLPGPTAHENLCQVIGEVSRIFSRQLAST